MVGESLTTLPTNQVPVTSQNARLTAGLSSETPNFASRHSEICGRRQMLTGAKLRMIRALKNISQADLAAQAGISTNAIAEFEQGKRELRSGTIKKLCDALGVQVRYIVDGTEITE